EDDLRRVVSASDGPAAELAGIIHCWSLDHPAADELSLSQLQDVQQTGVLSALRLMHALSDRMPPRVWFLTRDIYRIAPGDRSSGLASAPLVGLARVANNEFFPNRFQVVDLDPSSVKVQWEDLLYEFLSDENEFEIAYRDERRHVLRLGRVRAEELPVRTAPAIRSNGEIVPFRLQTS